MVGSFNGSLIGYKTYDKAQTAADGTKYSEKRHVYSVLCVGSQRDPQTKLFADDCKVIVVVEKEQTLTELTYGAKVGFYGELARDSKGNDYMRYSGIYSAASN